MKVNKIIIEQVVIKEVNFDNTMQLIRLGYKQISSKVFEKEISRDIDIELKCKEE